MGNKMVKVKYSLICRATRSVVTGTTTTPGKNFHAVSDKLKGIITANIPKFLKKHHPAEDPAQWELCGFVDWKEWAARKRRAALAMSASSQ